MEGKLGTRLQHVSLDDAQAFYEKAALGSGAAVLLHQLAAAPADDQLPPHIRLPLNCIDTATYRGCLVFLYYRDQCRTRLWGFVGSTYIAKCCTDSIEAKAETAAAAASDPVAKKKGYVDAATARNQLREAERKAVLDATFPCNLSFAAVPRWVFVLAGIGQVSALAFRWYTGSPFAGDMNLDECRCATRTRIDLHRYIDKHRLLTARLTAATLPAIADLVLDSSLSNEAKQMLFLDNKTAIRHDEIAFRMLLETLQMLHSLDKRIEVEAALAAFIRGERVIARIRAETVLFGDAITCACTYLSTRDLGFKRTILGRAFPATRPESKDAHLNRIAADHPLHSVVYCAPFETVIDLVGTRSVNLYGGNVVLTPAQMPTFALTAFSAILRGFSVSARTTAFSRMCNHHKGLSDLVGSIRRAFNIAMAGTSPETLAVSIGKDITQQDLDSGAVLPLCLSRLAAAEHMNHTERFQYSRLYFQAGGKLDALVKIWKPRFLSAYTLRNRGGGSSRGIESNAEFAKSQWNGVFGEFKHTDAKNKERRNTGVPTSCFAMMTKYKLCPFADAKLSTAASELACGKEAGFAPEVAHRSPLGYVEMFVVKRKLDRENAAAAEAKRQQELNELLVREKADEIAERKAAAIAKRVAASAAYYSGDKRKKQTEAAAAAAAPDPLLALFGKELFDPSDASLLLPVPAPMDESDL